MNILEGRLPNWWKTIDPEAHVDYKPLKPAALAFLGLPLAERREIVAEYSQKYCSPRLHKAEASGMYVFLRVVFDVPARYPREDAKVFGAWAGFSAGDDEGPFFNLSWPVTIAGDPPRLHVQPFDGYGGMPYDAIGEYEYFAGRFPFRSPETIAALIIE